MKLIFVNLKRFDVPRRLGGICDFDTPKEWVSFVLRETVQCGIGSRSDANTVYFLPEGLLITAADILSTFKESQVQALSLGLQGVFWENVVPDANFGAFTSLLPAAAAVGLGASWVIVGHSEERRAKLQLLRAYDKEIDGSPKALERARQIVDNIVGAEVQCAVGSKMNVLLCLGETEEDRGGGTSAEQDERTKSVIRSQLAAVFDLRRETFRESQIVLGYEPVWAIGPGKIPPDAGYITRILRYVKQLCKEHLGLAFPVVYGGGVKEENAVMLGKIDELDGGLIALTRFAPPLGFDPRGLAAIMQKYVNPEGVE